MSRGIVSNGHSRASGAESGMDGPGLTVDEATGSDGIFRVLWRRRVVVGCAMATALIAVAVYGLDARPLYTSTATIYVERCGPEALGEVQSVMTGTQNYLYTQAELLKCDAVLSAVLERVGMGKMAIFRGVDDPVTLLKGEGVRVTVGKQDELIRVSSCSPDAGEAAELVNAVVDCYLAWHRRVGDDRAEGVLEILRQERESYGEDMSKRVKAMEAFRREHPGVTYDSRLGNVVLRRLEWLSEALTEAQLRTVESRLAYESIAEQLEARGVSVEGAEASDVFAPSEEDAASLARRRSELLTRVDELKRQRDERRLEVTAEHPLIAGLDAEIGLIEEQIGHMDERSVRERLAAAREDYLAAKRRQQEVETYFEEQQRVAAEFNEQVARYAALECEWERARKLCEVVDEKIRAVSLSGQAGGLNIRVVERARPATVSSEPRRVEVFSAGLVVAVVFGCGCGIVRDRIDKDSVQK